MISDRLDKLVEEMVGKGVQFEDAVHEFEKRFIARVLGHCDGSLTRTADTLGIHRQHAHPEDGRVQTAKTGLIQARSAARPRRHPPRPTAR